MFFLLQITDRDHRDIVPVNIAETVPIKGVTETSFVDWPGKIVSVIFSPGCNFRCPFCQNVDLLVNSNLLPTIPVAHVLQRLAEFKGWIDGVCITGGEPTIHESLPEFITLLRKKNWLVKLDTNGSNPQMLEMLLKDTMIDCIAMDVKAPLDPLPYSRAIGVSADLEKIRKSIELIQSSSIEVIFRMTVVPGMISEEDIYRVAKDLYPAKKFVLQQFSPENPLDHRLKKVSPWPQEQLERVQHAVNQILQKPGGG
ncbi:MAG: anaerobic ribonucleoside-triphosphate reductase activating protein [Deltaproteobacteria bacterium]|nr:anaerobic ribonucleoside-triphosphate reductase activating protein [Deltaproteobacteria bacterium]